MGRSFFLIYLLGITLVTASLGFSQEGDKQLIPSSSLLFGIRSLSERGTCAVSYLMDDQNLSIINSVDLLQVINAPSVRKMYSQENNVCILSLDVSESGIIHDVILEHYFNEADTIFIKSCIYFINNLRLTIKRSNLSGRYYIGFVLLDKIISIRNFPYKEWMLGSGKCKSQIQHFNNDLDITRVVFPASEAHKLGEDFLNQIDSLGIKQIKYFLLVTDKNLNMSLTLDENVNTSEGNPSHHNIKNKLAKFLLKAKLPHAVVLNKDTVTDWVKCQFRFIAPPVVTNEKYLVDQVAKEGIYSGSTSLSVSIEADLNEVGSILLTKPIEQSIKDNSSAVKRITKWLNTNVHTFVMSPCVNHRGIKVPCRVLITILFVNQQPRLSVSVL